MKKAIVNMISANEARSCSDSFAEKTSIQTIYTAIEPELMRTIEEKIRLAMANGENTASMDLGDLVCRLVTRYLYDLKISYVYRVYLPLERHGGLLRIYKTVEIVLKSLGIRRTSVNARMNGFLRDTVRKNGSQYLGKMTK